ncbi:MAG: hypothetical protein IJ683_06725 [Butyrivibrio sp.]|nr:hypothetical protein [Butyrivibrio sp.]MBR1641996.1 hypothetical protein [Butyrivibrio sp.]
MNSKIIGAIAVTLSFGVGLAIPNIAGAGTIDNYEQAKAIVEKKSEEQAKGEVKEAAKEAEKEAKKEETAEKEEALAKQEAAKPEKTEGASKESAASVVNPNADVVIDFTFDDIKVNGVKLVESDYDSMLEGFGFDKVQVHYTDGSFKIDSDPFEWNGKKASYHGGYEDENRATQDLYFDGEKFVTWDLTEKESVKNSIYINGSWEDKDNYTDYWSFDYNNELQNNGANTNDYIYFGNYGKGLSDEDIKEINSFLTAPFTGGDYAAMNAVMHTDEMIEKGLKDESTSRENYDRYIVDTSLGKCVLTVSLYENNDGKQTGYYYEFEDGKYSVNVWFRDGIESASSIHYFYRH